MEITKNSLKARSFSGIPEIISGRVLLTALFAASVFIISNDNALKIASISVSSLVALLMLALFIAEGLITGTQALKPHPLQKPLYILFAWTVASLLASHIIPSKFMHLEAYSFSWATGINSPSYRGYSFLLRFFLSIFAIEFVVSALNTRSRFLLIVNIILMLYAMVVFYGIAQVFLFIFLDISMGTVLTAPYLRFAGYVGEPQTFGLLLISMLFTSIGALKYRFEGCWFSQNSLKILLIFAVVILVLTFSISMITGALITAMLFLKRFRLRTVFLFVFLAGALVYVFYDFINGALVAKFFSELTSMNSRTLTWEIGYRIISMNPISGAGIGQSPLIAKTISEGINLSFAVLDFDAYRVAILNSYMEWTAETGVVGLLLLAFAGYRAYGFAKISGSSMSDFTKLAFGGSIIAQLVSANSFGSIFYVGCFNFAIGMYLAGLGLDRDNKI